MLDRNRNRHIFSYSVTKGIFNFAEDGDSFVARELQIVDTETLDTSFPVYQDGFLTTTDTVNNGCYIIHDNVLYRQLSCSKLSKSATYMRDWSDRSNFVFPYVGRLTDPYNAVIEGVLGKLPSPRTVGIKSTQCMAQVYVASENDDMLQSKKSFCFHPESTIITTIDLGIEETLESVLSGSSLRYFAHFALSCDAATVKPNEPITITVKSFDVQGEPWAWSGELRIEMVHGYAPSTRVHVVDGVGQFKVVPLMLEPGDKMRVKVGHHYYTGLAEIEFDVI